MAIQASRNLSYGSTTVTTKYRPLDGLTYSTGQIAEYGALFTNRIEQLRNANVFPQPLLLCTANWEGLIPAGVGNAPPLVVISTNRSKWIAAGIRMADEQFKKKKYAGSNDLKALMGNVKDQKQSPPLYAPRRTEGDRKIFIMVHMHEYHQYATALAGLGVTVVGWSFKTRATAPAPLCGFGASRYVAVEFCKHLREKMGEVKKWDYAWLLDDNVVGITGFPGYELVEEAMRTASATDEQVCSAFKGGSNVQGFFATKDWAEKEDLAGRGKPTVLPETAQPEVIQQAALWNIKYLADNNLNFAPLFVGSAEDVSLGNYLQAKIHGAKKPFKRLPYLFYTMKVIKEEFTNDDSRGSKMIGKARDTYAKWFADEESKATPGGRTAPPPVRIESTTTQTVSDFITTWFNETVATRRPQVDGPRDPKVQAKAKCQVVEQAACGAIWDGVWVGEEERKQCYVAKDVLDRTFKVPGAGQYIYQLEPPPPRRT